MRKIPLILLLCVLSLALFNCAGRAAAELESIEERFARGQAFFMKEKWSRAAEDFNWVVLNNPAGNLAIEAQYYYAESLYQQEMYVEAQIEFERLLRRWAGTKHLIEARYRIVQCLVLQSPRTYYYDQKATLDAIDELQTFIDDFPESTQREEAEVLIDELRLKIAQKNYESGRLYLKWRRLAPARLYFEKVLSQFYDTAYADEARVGIVVSYILQDDIKAARDYLEENGARFTDEELYSEAQRYIEMAQQDKFDLDFYLRLYK
ncbi:MAG: outer membrane protein assembly factor BamD [Fidelibacterota bacterium]|nr:MAG: outer membrane protein assembly factor BamD [Candidatus Neomarinimicrobiota bacterium]